MGTLPLQPPNARFHAIPLDIVPVAPSSLCRISGQLTGEPYFGRTGGCRFDDASKHFGTCYPGTDLKVAFAASVLHDAAPLPEHVDFGKTMKEFNVVVL